MHISTFIPVSLSLAASVYSQSAPQPAVSISIGSAAPPAASNPGAVGAATSAGVSGSSSVLAAPPSANTGAGVIGSNSVPVWVVKVGSPDNQIVFAPNTITAKPGEMVQFQFYAQNHSVATSTFDQPCVPQMGAPGQGAASAATTNAFWSGFMPTQDDGSLTYTIPIRDTNPIWFYCSQAKHCQGGMVGVINPAANSPDTLQAYAAKAATAPENISPNSGASNAGAAAPVNSGAGVIGSGTATGITAQSTKSSASSVVRRGCWELAAAALVAVMLL